MEGFTGQRWDGRRSRGHASEVRRRDVYHYRGAVWRDSVFNIREHECQGPGLTTDQETPALEHNVAATLVANGGRVAVANVRSTT